MVKGQQVELSHDNFTRAIWHDNKSLEKKKINFLANVEVLSDYLSPPTFDETSFCGAQSRRRISSHQTYK